MTIFLHISFNISFGCSKEPSHHNRSFEYQQHMFWLRNKKIVFRYAFITILWSFFTILFVKFHNKNFWEPLCCFQICVITRSIIKGYVSLRRYTSIHDIFLVGKYKLNQFIVYPIFCTKNFPTIIAICNYVWNFDGFDNFNGQLPNFVIFSNHFFFKVMKWFSFYMTCCNYQMLLYFSILFIKKGSFDFVLK